MLYRLGIGYGLVLACSPLTSGIGAALYVDSFDFGATGWWHEILFALFFFMILGVFGAFPKRMGAVVRSVGFQAGGLAALELSFFLLFAVGHADLSSWLSPFCIGAGSFLRALGVVVFQVAYVETFSVFLPRYRSTSRSLMVALVVSALLGMTVWVLAASGRPNEMLAILALFPAVSFALLVGLRSASLGLLGKRASGTERIRMPKATKFIIGSQGIVLGCIWSVLFTAPDGRSSSFLICLGFLLFSVGLAAVSQMPAFRRFSRYGTSLRLVMTLSSAVFLLVPVLAGWLPGAALLFLGLVWPSYVIMFTLMPAQMAEKLPADFLSIVSSGGIATGVGVLLSSAIGLVAFGALGASTLFYSVMAMVACLPVLAAVQMVPPDATDASIMGVEGLMGGETEEERLERRVSEVAQQAALTPREEEVMALLVQGLSRGRIAARLVVSDETVKTHIKRIYGKLDVHSLRELASLVETGKHYGRKDD